MKNKNLGIILAVIVVCMLALLGEENSLFNKIFQSGSKCSCECETQTESGESETGENIMSKLTFPNKSTPIPQSSPPTPKRENTSQTSTQTPKASATTPAPQTSTQKPKTPATSSPAPAPAPAPVPVPVPPTQKPAPPTMTTPPKPKAVKVPPPPQPVQKTEEVIRAPDGRGPNLVITNQFSTSTGRSIFHRINMQEHKRICSSMNVERSYAVVSMYLFKRLNEANHSYSPIGGTLLGFYRTHTIIPGDDDVDIAITIEASRFLFEVVEPEVREKFGWTMRFTGGIFGQIYHCCTTTNWHSITKLDHAIDLYPFYEADGLMGTTWVPCSVWTSEMFYPRTNITWSEPGFMPMNVSTHAKTGEYLKCYFGPSFMIPSKKKSWTGKVCGRSNDHRNLCVVTRQLMEQEYKAKGLAWGGS